MKGLIVLALIFMGCAEKPVQPAEPNRRPDAHWEHPVYPVLVCNDTGRIIGSVSPTVNGWQVDDGSVRHPEFATKDQAKRFVEREARECSK